MSTIGYIALILAIVASVGTLICTAEGSSDDHTT
jgi:hypothetical protein